MLTIDALRDYGADIEEAMTRCMNNEDFYLRLVGLVRDDANFDALEKAVAAGDLKAGFDAAHALKGVCGNLALKPLYDPVLEITELLRARTETDYTDLLAQIREKKEALFALFD
jgi:HPt (histidine-containing phosphotransfer) domain-containing protein